MEEKLIVNKLTTKVNESVQKLESDLKTFKTGRANPSILDNVKVEVYGSLMPLKQVSSINVMDAKMIQLVPFDPNTISNISDAIRNDASLGLNPSDDGHVVRLSIPPLTEERRKELVKQISVKVEECFVRIRASRHEIIKEIDQQLKDKQISQEMYNRVHKQIESIIQDQKMIVDNIASKKEQEIMTI